MSSPKFTMKISLNVLNHLGLNLYSNVPAVLSEAVANSWDADATKVDVEVDIQNRKIVITDDGHGMSEDDINDKYLNVGYTRRENESPKTEKFERPVMGRKGIGKLSLFSIAETVEIQTVKNGEKSGFVMSVPKIKEVMEDEDGDYHPEPLPESKIDLEKNGTRITLTDLKRRVNQAAKYLRKRLARRFSIIGSGHNFVVNVDGKPISIDDRDYFHKLRYMWYFGSESEKYRELCKGGLEDAQKERGEIEISGANESVVGWIGSVKESGDLTDSEGADNLNKIVIMVRGKLAQENILEDFREGGLYTKFLIGEIHADFLDTDDKDDIATSNRQEIIKDDPRYEALQYWVIANLKTIQRRWIDLRKKEGVRQATQIPAVEEWLGQLDRKARSQAESLLGKIGQLTLDPNEKIDLYKHSVLAFESLRYKGSLDKLDHVSVENLQEFTKVFADLNDIESTLYYQIVQERLHIIQKLHQNVEENVKEKVIQKYLYNHLWLLDPSWDRATETPLMEQNVDKEFNKLDADLNDVERKGRYDIKYKMTSGKHVIIELKRADRSIDQYDLMKQVSNYAEALRKLIRAAEKQEPVEVVCIVGKPLSQWKNDENEERSRKEMAAANVRVVLYDELIEDAYRSYQAFVEKNREAGRVHRLIQNIEEDMLNLAEEGNGQ